MIEREIEMKEWMDFELIGFYKRVDIGMKVMMKWYICVIENKGIKVIKYLIYISNCL